MLILKMKLKMKQQLTEGRDFYFDDKGYIVFTKHYLLQKGSCCGNGCRHCPFDYVNVTEPEKSFLLAKKNLIKK